MKVKCVSILILSIVCLCGCTSVALRRNAFNQSKTVSDLLADQILYNLALYKDYYESDRINGLPSFVKLSSGQAAVQQSLNGQMGLKIMDVGTVEKDPQLTGNHQTTDNWTFTPVTDPNEINRLYCLYRAEFRKATSNELTVIFPAPSAQLDQQGRPYLDYTPVLNTNDGTVLITNNQPVFTAKPKAVPSAPTIFDIPGSITNDTTKEVNEGWASFSEPANATPSSRMGPYLNHYIWITNRTNFFKFALLALGGTNVSANTKSSQPLFLINGGVISTVPQ